MSIWVRICLVFFSILGVRLFIDMLAQGHFMSALFAIPVVFWLFYFVVHVGAMAFNVFSVAGDVLEVNLRESDEIRRRD
jgi:hypothetical protein